MPLSCTVCDNDNFWENSFRFIGRASGPTSRHVYMVFRPAAGAMAQAKKRPAPCEIGTGGHGSGGGTRKGSPQGDIRGFKFADNSEFVCLVHAQQLGIILMLLLDTRYEQKVVPRGCGGTMWILLM